jgi:hypothetical protein
LQLIRLACAALLVTASAAGCSSAGVHTASAVSVRVTSRAVPTASPNRSPGSSPSQPSSTPVPLGPCATADLSVAAGSEHAEEGLEITRFVLTNIAQNTCTLSGYPGISPEGALTAGDASPQVNLAVSQLAVPPELGAIAQPGGDHTLQPGAAAAFFIAWYPASPVVCEAGEGFSFNAPGDSDMADSSPQTYPFGPMCDGLFYVSQVFSPATQD